MGLILEAPVSEGTMKFGFIANISHSRGIGERSCYLGIKSDDGARIKHCRLVA